MKTSAQELIYDENFFVEVLAFKRLVVFIIIVLSLLIVILATVYFWHEISELSTKKIFSYLGIILMVIACIVMIRKSQKIPSPANKWDLHNPLLADQFQHADNWQKFGQLCQKKLKPSFFQKITGRRNFPYKIKPENFV